MPGPMFFLDQRLHASVRAACPHVIGIGIGDWRDRSTWKVAFKENATAEQKAAVADVLANFETPELDQLG